MSLWWHKVQRAMAGLVTVGSGGDSWRLILSPQGIAVSGPGQPAHFVAEPGLSWHRSLALAQIHLHEKCRSASLEVILAGVWGRCILSPSVNELPSSDDVALLSRQSLAEAFGPESINWQVAAHIQGPGFPLIVSALESGWLADLEKMAAGCGFTLSTVESLLAASWNRCCRQLPHWADWFALLEPARVQIVGLREGNWTSLASMRKDAGDVEGTALVTLLSREARLAGLPTEGEVWVCSTCQPPSVDGRWQWRMLASEAALSFGRLREPV